MGLVRSPYSQRSASKSFRAFLRTSKSDCRGATKILEHEMEMNNAQRTQDRIGRNLLFGFKTAPIVRPSRLFDFRGFKNRSPLLPTPDGVKFSPLNATPFGSTKPSRGESGVSQLLE